MSVELQPNQWDAEAQSIIGHPMRRQLMAFISEQKITIDTLLFRMTTNGELIGLTLMEIRDKVLAALNPVPVEKIKFDTVFQDALSLRHGRTRDLYRATYRRVKAYLGRDLDTLGIDDIDSSWLRGFDKFLARTAPSVNARSIHLRNLRAVFNYALDNELTTHYPFRQYKIKSEPTQKRAMSIAEIRKVMFTPLPAELRPYRDMWALSFLLLGINVVDLCSLGDVDGAGRLQYIRAKTHRPYSIKVWPEAMEIINRYRGVGQLLYMLDRYKTYRVYYSALCRGLHSVMEALNAIDDGVRIHSLTTYRARHSWATTAALLDIPKETIAAALGHGGYSVTDIYIDYDKAKVDEANRRVIEAIYNQ
jgi:integrase